MRMPTTATIRHQQRRSLKETSSWRQRASTVCDIVSGCFILVGETCLLSLSRSKARGIQRQRQTDIDKTHRQDSLKNRSSCCGKFPLDATCGFSCSEKLLHYQKGQVAHARKTYLQIDCESSVCTSVNVNAFVAFCAGTCRAMRAALAKDAWQRREASRRAHLAPYRRKRDIYIYIYIYI